MLPGLPYFNPHESSYNSQNFINQSGYGPAPVTRAIDETHSVIKRIYDSLGSTDDLPETDPGK